MAKIPVSRWLLLAVLAAAVAFAVVALSTAALLPSASQPVVQVAAYGLLIAVALLLFLWLLWQVAHLFLWRVGRRLAFSYFLIGFLPIPMVLLLLFLNGYLLAGYFLGHLYRDAVHEIHQELSQAATSRLAAVEQDSRDSKHIADNIALATYRGGQRVSGDKRLPPRWPTWLASPEGEETSTFFALPDGSPTLAAARARRLRFLPTERLYGAGSYLPTVGDFQTYRSSVTGLDSFQGTILRNRNISIDQASRLR